MTRRYIHVCTSHGVGLPALNKAAAAEIFANAADAQLAKGRRRPVTTNVMRYVSRRAPTVARQVHRILDRHGQRIAARVAALGADRLGLRKDDAELIRRILSILEELNLDDMGVDVNGELVTAMLAAFKRAAALGLTQASFPTSDEIVALLDEHALAFSLARGAELVTAINATTRTLLQTLVANAIEQGQSVSMLQAAIRAAGAFSASRAETIARTELAFAHVQGNLAGWRASGVVAGKRWLLADTHPESDECDEAADAGSVDLEAEFLPGIKAPPAHPNCLCDLLPVLKPDDNEDNTP